MKRVIFLIAALAVLSDASAREVRTRASEAKRTACQLFTEGKTAAAIAQVRANAQAEEGPDGKTTALIQNLIGVSVTLHNQGHARAAQAAATAALDAATSVTNGRSSATVKRREELSSALGVLCETVLHDLDRAQLYYTAAVQLDPNDALAKQRLETVRQKNAKKGGAQ